jgi:hydroxymethylglutaryl-CoA lyase
MLRAAGGKRLFIHDVAPRDGLQIEPVFVDTARKIALVDALSRTGLAKIEVTSFTSPKAIPALADAADVMAGIQRAPGVEYAALVPNVKGAERALACRVDELNVVMSASESHNRANLRMSREQSLSQFADIVGLARGAAAVNASLSTAFGCPFEGRFETDRVLPWVDRIAALGIRRLTLCDTTGMADPAQAQQLCAAVRERHPHLVLTAHFHDTRGMALANVLAALEAGIERFDASLGGLGGCPFAPGASGNACTEDMVHMLQQMGYDTGVDLPALLDCARSLAPLVGHELAGQLVKAGPSSRRYPLPVAATAQVAGVGACA